MKIRSNDGECEYHYIEESPNFYIARHMNSAPVLLDKKNYIKINDTKDVTSECTVGNSVGDACRSSILRSNKSGQVITDIMHKSQRNKYIIKRISAAEAFAQDPKATCFIVREIIEE